MAKIITDILNTIDKATIYAAVIRNIELLKNHERKHTLTLLGIQKVLTKLCVLALAQKIAIDNIKEDLKLILDLFNNSTAFDKSSSAAGVFLKQLNDSINSGNIRNLQTNDVEVDLEDDIEISINNKKSKSPSSVSALEVEVEQGSCPDPNFDWIDVGSGGNCLYLSLFDQLTKRKISGINCSNAHQLRIRIADHITSNFQKFENSITDNELLAAGVNVEFLKEMKNIFLGEYSNFHGVASILPNFFVEFNKYISYLKKDGVWGDQKSIVAASHLFQVNIVVKPHNGGPDMSISCRNLPNINGEEFPNTIYIGSERDVHFKSLWVKAGLETVSSQSAISSSTVVPVVSVAPEVARSEHKRLARAAKKREERLAFEARLAEWERLDREEAERAARLAHEAAERERVFHEAVAAERAAERERQEGIEEMFREAERTRIRVQAAQAQEERENLARRLRIENLLRELAERDREDRLLNQLNQPNQQQSLQEQTEVCIIEEEEDEVFLKTEKKEVKKEEIKKEEIKKEEIKKEEINPAVIFRNRMAAAANQVERINILRENRNIIGTLPGAEQQAMVNDIQVAGDLTTALTDQAALANLRQAGRRNR